MIFPLMDKVWRHVNNCEETGCVPGNSLSVKKVFNHGLILSSGLILHGGGHSVFTSRVIDTPGT